MKVACIVNPVAGPKRNAPEIAETVRRTAAACGWECTVIPTESRGQATSLARRAAESGADLVLAAGGDGTIHEVARGLLGSGVSLGIVAMGSGNGLARAVGIPLNPRGAVESAFLGESRPFDVGYVNDEPFFAFAGFGLDAEIARRYDTMTRRRGIVPYIWHGLAEWYAYRPEPVTIRIGGHSFVECPLVAVFANTEQYGAGAVIAPGARPDDGSLRFCRIAPIGFPRIVFEMPRLFRGTIARSRYYIVDDIVEVVVERARPGMIQVDGEPMQAEAILKFRVDPGALMIRTAVAPR